MPQPSTATAALIDRLTDPGGAASETGNEKRLIIQRQVQYGQRRVLRETQRRALREEYVAVNHRPRGPAPLIKRANNERKEGGGGGRGGIRHQSHKTN